MQPDDPDQTAQPTPQTQPDSLSIPYKTYCYTPRVLPSGCGAQPFLGKNSRPGKIVKSDI
jgi:hypothetical protein